MAMDGNLCNSFDPRLRGGGDWVSLTMSKIEENRGRSANLGAQACRGIMRRASQHASA